MKIKFPLQQFLLGFGMLCAFSLMSAHFAKADTAIQFVAAPGRAETCTSTTTTPCQTTVYNSTLQSGQTYLWDAAVINWDSPPGHPASDWMLPPDPSGGQCTAQTDCQLVSYKITNTNLYPGTYTATVRFRNVGNGQAFGYASVQLLISESAAVSSGPSSCTVSITAPSTAISGSNFNVTWDSNGCSTVNVSGPSVSSADRSGYQTVTAGAPNTVQTYFINGYDTLGRLATASKTVDIVANENNPNYYCDYSSYVSPISITLGQSVRVLWNVTDSGGCYSSGGSGMSSWPLEGSGVSGPYAWAGKLRGDYTITPTAAGNYNFRQYIEYAEPPGSGNYYCCRSGPLYSVTVNASAPCSPNVSAAPTSVPNGYKTHITWTTCSALKMIDPSGSVFVGTGSICAGTVSSRFVQSENLQYSECDSNNLTQGGTYVFTSDAGAAGTRTVSVVVSSPAAKNCYITVSSTINGNPGLPAGGFTYTLSGPTTINGTAPKTYTRAAANEVWTATGDANNASTVALTSITPSNMQSCISGQDTFISFTFNFSDQIPPRPDPPTVENTTPTSGVACSTIRISWSAVSTATSYKLYRSTSPTNPGAVWRDNLTSLSYTDVTPVSGTSYYYWLQAANSAGVSQISNYGGPIMMVDCTADFSSRSMNVNGTRTSGIRAGDTVTVVINLPNRGPIDARTVVVTDDLAGTNMTYDNTFTPVISYTNSGSGTTSVSGTTLTFNVGTVAAYQTATITFKAKVTAPLSHISEPIVLLAANTQNQFRISSQANITFSTIYPPTNTGCKSTGTNAANPCIASANVVFYANSGSAGQTEVNPYQ